MGPSIPWLFSVASFALDVTSRTPQSGAADWATLTIGPHHDSLPFESASDTLGLRSGIARPSRSSSHRPSTPATGRPDLLDRQIVCTPPDTAGDVTSASRRRATVPSRFLTRIPGPDRHGPTCCTATERRPAARRAGRPVAPESLSGSRDSTLPCCGRNAPNDHHPTVAGRPRQSGMAHGIAWRLALCPRRCGAVHRLDRTVGLRSRICDVVDRCVTRSGHRRGGQGASPKPRTHGFVRRRPARPSCATHTRSGRRAAASSGLALGTDKRQRLSEAGPGLMRGRRGQLAQLRDAHFVTVGPALLQTACPSGCRRLRPEPFAVSRAHGPDRNLLRPGSGCPRGLLEGMAGLATRPPHIATGVPLPPCGNACLLGTSVVPESRLTAGDP